MSDTAPAAPKKTRYRTAPVPSPNMPGGIPYIIGNEAAERFSFYGMRGILVVFMTQHLVNSLGEKALMSEPHAEMVFHLFGAAVYAFSVFGALLADVFLGKYRTILLLSIVYCLGHLTLAIDLTRIGLFIGLALIAIGAGGIKPCVSAHVGDQFGKTNQHLLSRVFGWFYLSINLGAFIASLLIPWVLNFGGAYLGYDSKYNAHLAFGIPGVLMALATLFFWMGRNKFIHIPAPGFSKIVRSLGKEELSILGKLSLVFVPVIGFWALFDQTGSSWVNLSKRMNCTLFEYTRVDGTPGQWNVLESQIQALNPALILILVPLFTLLLYPWLGKLLRVSPIRKITWGMFVGATAFVVPALIAQNVAGGGQPSVLWLIPAYVLLTAAEVMISITCLEFAYTQAPKSLKSFIMCYYLLSISLGNMVTAGINALLCDAKGERIVSEANYFWIFVGLMLFTATLFTIVALFYREKTYIQDEEELPSDDDSGPEPQPEPATA